MTQEKVEPEFFYRQKKFSYSHTPVKPGVAKNCLSQVPEHFIEHKKIIQLDKLETTPLRVVVSYAYLVFSQPPRCLRQAM